MSSLYSTSLKLELIGTGDQTGLWGSTTNTNLGTALEQAIVGKASLVTGDFTANVATLTLTDTNASQTARAFVLDVTATLSAAGTINVPAVQKPYIVFNNTVGGFTLTVKVSGLTGVVIPNGKRVLVYNNGTDVIDGITYLNGVATSATTATNLAAGVANNLPYQTGAGATAYITAPSIAGYVLSWTGSAFAWAAAPAATTAASLAGGSAGVIPYQSALDTTAFTAVGTAGKALLSGGAGVPTWGNVSLTAGVTGILPVTNGGTGVATLTGIVKASGTSNFAAAVAGTDYSVPVSITGMVKSSGTTQSLAIVRVDYAEPTTALATGILKNTITTGAHTIAVAGTDYIAPSGALGTPSSGTLTNCTKDGTNGVGYLNIPQNSQSVAYTLVLADQGKHILHPSADTTARIFTIPANASVAYPIGTAITFVNQASAGTLTIAITTDVMRLAGAGTTGSRTLAANGVATAVKLTATEWIISGTNLT